MPQQSGSHTLGRARIGTDVDDGQLLDFNDAGRWRRLFAELMGTFFLVLAAAGATMMDHAVAGEIGRVAAVTSPGVTVMAAILFMGRVSGAHVNPAVTIGFALRGDFPSRRRLHSSWAGRWAVRLGHCAGNDR